MLPAKRDIVRAGVWVASVVAVVATWKHEACYDGGNSVALAWPGSGAFVPDTHEAFDRWAVVTGLFVMAGPAWDAKGVGAPFAAAGGWVLLHAGAASLSGVTCPPHDERGPSIQYGPGLVAAYTAALFVAASMAWRA